MFLSHHRAVFDLLTSANSFFFLFQGIWTFLVAAYPKYAASVMAVNTTTRSLLAAAFPLFTDQSQSPYMLALDELN